MARAGIIVALAIAGCSSRHLSPDEFGEALIEATCERQYTCFGESRHFVAACLERHYGIYMQAPEDYGKAVAAHRAIYDESKARACIDRLLEEPCLRDPSAPRDDTCSLAFKGLAQTGEACFTSLDCASASCRFAEGRWACEPAFVPFTRAVPATIGTPCGFDRGPERICGGGRNLYCRAVQLQHSLAGTCQPRIPEGETCPWSSGFSDEISWDYSPCAEGLACVGAEIRFFAVAPVIPGTCLPLSDEGGACVTGNDRFSGCRAGLACVDGTCALPPISGPCLAGRCRWPESYCDVSGMCKAYLPSGAPCSCDTPCAGTCNLSSCSTTGVCTDSVPHEP